MSPPGGASPGCRLGPRVPGSNHAADANQGSGERSSPHPGDFGGACPEPVWVLVTGMSGTATAALAHELRRRAHTAYDAHEDGFSEPRADGRSSARAGGPAPEAPLTTGVRQQPRTVGPAPGAGRLAPMSAIPLSQLPEDVARRILVNNAGTVDAEPAIDEPLERFTDVLNVNLVAPLALAQRAAKAMLD